MTVSVPSYSTPSEVHAEEGQVLVEGPDGVAVSLTADAATRPPNGWSAPRTTPVGRRSPRNARHKVGIDAGPIDVQLLLRQGVGNMVY